MLQKEMRRQRSQEQLRAQSEERKLHARQRRELQDRNNHLRFQQRQQSDDERIHAWQACKKQMREMHQDLLVEALSDLALSRLHSEDIKQELAKKCDAGA